MRRRPGWASLAFFSEDEMRRCLCPIHDKVRTLLPSYQELMTRIVGTGQKVTIASWWPFYHMLSSRKFVCERMVRRSPNEFFSGLDQALSL